MTETTGTPWIARLFVQPKTTLNQSIWWACGLSALDLMIWSIEGYWWLSHNSPPATPPIITLLSPIHFALILRIVAHLKRVKAQKDPSNYRTYHTPPIIFTVLYLILVALYMVLAVVSKL